MDFYTATADSLHKQFIATIKELNDTSNTFWRKECIKDLVDIQTQAKQLLELNVLHELDAAKLKHILGRSVKEFVYYARHGKPTKNDTNYIASYGALRAKPNATSP